MCYLPDELFGKFRQTVTEICSFVEFGSFRTFEPLDLEPRFFGFLSIFDMLTIPIMVALCCIYF